MPPEMKFEDNANEFGAPPSANANGGFTQRLIDWGMVSNKQEAEYVMIGVGVLALIVAYFIYHSVGGSTPPPPPSGI